MPITYDPGDAHYAHGKKNQIKSLAELQRFLLDLDDGITIHNETLINHFLNNSFDLVKNLKGQHFFAIRAVKEKGQILLIPPHVLHTWYNTLTEDESNALPEAYRDYFTAQHYPEQPIYPVPNQHLDNDFALLKTIRRAEHAKNPALRQNALEKIPAPYRDVRDIRSMPNWEHNYNELLINQLNNNALKLQECDINDIDDIKKKRVILLEPVKKNTQPALFLTNGALVTWYNNLTPSQQRSVPPVYRNYFEHPCAGDRNLEQFTQIQNARITGGANNVVNPININPPAGQGVNPNAFYQPVNQPNLPFARITPAAVQTVARLPQNNWEVGTTPHTGDGNRIYHTVKSGTLMVEQYEDGVHARSLTPPKAKMMIALAGTASPVLSISNDDNDISALAVLFDEAFKQGKIPVVKPSTKPGAPAITQENILNEMANFAAYSTPNPTPQAKLEANFVALGAESTAARNTYNRAVPPAQPQLNPPDPRNNP